MTTLRREYNIVGQDQTATVLRRFLASMAASIHPPRLDLTDGTIGFIDFVRHRAFWEIRLVGFHGSVGLPGSTIP